MPHILALEWDDAEARLAVADVRRDGVVLEQAFAVTLASSRLSGHTSVGPGSISVSGAHDLGPVSLSGAHDLAAIGRRINEALAGRGIRRGRTLVAVGRANIELKNLTLPPCPPEELPELVRFQAEKEFNALSDESPLDYIPLPGEPEEALTVLAAAISPELIGEIETTCQGATLTPQRLILRPCAAASLLCRAQPGKGNKLRLLIDLLAEETDLTVLAGDAVVFMRTARLPVESFHADPLRALLPEIRRTIAAVHNRFTGRHVEEVFLCGEPTQQGGLAREIGRELEIPTEVFNPLSCCTLGPELRRNMPEQPGRFAPLVGMLLDESSPGISTIDFLNPRRKKEAPSRRREYTIAAAAAALLLLVGGVWIWFQMSGMDDTIEELKTQVGQLTKDVKPKVELINQASEIDDWLAGGVNWLDEIAFLSIKAPPSQDFILTSFNTIRPDIRTRTSGVHLKGAVQNSKIVEQINSRGNVENHDVTLNDSTDTTREAADRKLSDLQRKYPISVDVDIKITNPAATAKAAAKGPAGGAARPVANQKSS